MDLFDIDLSRILPASLMEDSSMQAAALAAQVQMVAISRLMNNVAIWARLDELTEPLLSTLAWQLHVDDFEGWGLAETDDQKRTLLRESLLIHRYKGTRWSLERMFELLNIQGSIREWFEYGGDPYRFMVTVAVDRAVPEAFAKGVLDLVNALKNTRSWLDRLLILEQVQPAASLAADMTIALVEPFPTSLSFRDCFDVVAADVHTMDQSGLSLTESLVEPFPLAVASPGVERLGLDAFPRFDQVRADFAPLDLTLEVTHV